MDQNLKGVIILLFCTVEWNDHQMKWCCTSSKNKLFSSYLYKNKSYNIWIVES